MSKKPLIELDMKELKKSIDEVQKNLDKAEKIALEALANAAILVAFDLLGEGMRRAPKDTGHLRGSGVAFVNKEKVAHTINSMGQSKLVKDSFEAKVGRLLNEIIGEVGFNTEYAAKQHEEVGYHHQDGEAKYLERPLMERAQYYVEIMNLKVKEALGGS